MERNFSDVYDMALLRKAVEAWQRMDEFRRDRDRNKRFTYGDQWSDYVPVEGGMMREEDYIRSQGNIPLKNNLTRRLVRNVLGVFRNRWQQPGCTHRDSAEKREASTMNRLLQYNSDLNRLEELYARTMEEFLISGLAIHKKWYGSRNRKSDCWTDIVQPDCFFADSDARDCRGWDFSLMGEIHEMDFNSLCAAFASTKHDRDRLRRAFSGVEAVWGADAMGIMNQKGAFQEEPMFRVFEIWTRRLGQGYRCHDQESGKSFFVSLDDIEDIYKENERRIAFGRPLIRRHRQVSEEWCYKFLAPSGMVLAEGVSPYRHGMHPYVIKAYPFIDGEIHSFVSDIIDQQKFTNRLISMYDWILRSSAKGVLLFPEGALPQGVDINDVAEEWSRFNGVIVFKPRPGMPLPQQVSSNATNIGITELLNIQMKMMEDISGVNGALQGKLDSGSMSGTLYDQQTRNSLTALADLMKTFEEFIADATERDISNIRQFYTPSKIASILGDSPSVAPGFHPRRNFTDPASDFRLSLAD